MYHHSYVCQWEIFWIDGRWPTPQRARFWCAQTLLHDDDEVFSKILFLICILFFGQRVILSRLCISKFRGFFWDFSVFRRSEHAWMPGILVTCVNSDESAQSACCARSPRHMLSHHFCICHRAQRAWLACESKSKQFPFILKTTNVWDQI